MDGMRTASLTILQLVLAGTTCSILSNCEKHAATNNEPVEQPTPAPMLESTPAATATSVPAVEANPKESLAPGRESSTETAISLQQKFLSTSDINERENIVHYLGELHSAEAIDIIYRLFQLERAEEVKLDMLGTVERMEIEDAHKIPIMATALQPDQPQEVRETGIDVLADFTDPGAIQLLQNLMNDPNPDIREAAKEALQDATETSH
jgi:HEAT repeat protein